MSEQALPPNFDDERTLLSARRVVPLNQIDAEVRRKRRWFLCGAFAVAMMLGAASALVASYLRLRNTPVPVTDEMSATDVATIPVAVGNPAPQPSESPVT